LAKAQILENARDFIAYRDKCNNSFPSYEQILESVGRLIRRQGCLTLDQLIEVSDWKAGRRNRRNINRNSPENVIRVTRHAFSLEDDETRIRALHSPNLHGVRVPVVSAILTFHDPRKYGVIDQHTARSLYRNREVFQRRWRLNSRFFRKKKLIGLTIDDYVEYLAIVRRVAGEVSGEEGVEFTPRDVDKALWQEDKEKWRASTF